jgi:hypothetical protein
LSIEWESLPLRQGEGGGEETQQFTADPILNNKIKSATAGLLPSIQKMFLDFPTDNDKQLVVDYLQACIKQENIAVRTKRVYILIIIIKNRNILQPDNAFKTSWSFN